MWYIERIIQHMKEMTKSFFHELTHDDPDDPSILTIIKMSFVKTVKAFREFYFYIKNGPRADYFDDDNDYECK